MNLMNLVIKEIIFSSTNIETQFKISSPFCQSQTEQFKNVNHVFEWVSFSKLVENVNYHGVC